MGEKVKRLGPSAVRHQAMDNSERVKLKACQAAVPIVWGYAPGIVCRGANHIPDNCYCTILSALMPLSSCANWSRRTEASRRRITCPVRSSGRPALGTATCRLARLSTSVQGNTKTQDKPLKLSLESLVPRGLQQTGRGQGPSRASAAPLEGLNRRHALGWPTTRQPAVARSPRVSTVHSDQLPSADWPGLAWPVLP